MAANLAAPLAHPWLASAAAWVLPRKARADIYGSVVALSVDDEATTQNLISRQGLPFPRLASPDEPFRAKQAVEERSVLLVAQGGQQPLEILTARAARTQVSRQARIPLFGRGTCQRHRRARQAGVQHRRRCRPARRAGRSRRPRRAGAEGVPARRDQVSARSARLLPARRWQRAHLMTTPSTSPWPS
jgi:hypothetical protein